MLTLNKSRYLQIVFLFFTENKILFVCVEVLWSSQPDGVMSSAVTSPNHTFTGQIWSTKQLTSIVYILLPEIKIW